MVVTLVAIHNHAEEEIIVIEIDSSWILEASSRYGRDEDQIAAFLWHHAARRQVVATADMSLDAYMPNAETGRIESVPRPRGYR